MKRGTERFIYRVVDTEGKTIGFEHFDKAMRYFNEYGVKLYFVTKNLFPTVALAYWK